MTACASEPAMARHLAVTMGQANVQDWPIKNGPTIQAMIMTTANSAVIHRRQLPSSADQCREKPIAVADAPHQAMTP